MTNAGTRFVHVARVAQLTWNTREHRHAIVDWLNQNLGEIWDGTHEHHGRWTLSTHDHDGLMLINIHTTTPEDHALVTMTWS